MGGIEGCPACGRHTVADGARRRCLSCGHRTWALAVDLTRASPLDDVALKGALRSQRRAESSRLLDRLGPIERVIDVGCSTGDFLGVCRARGIEAVGVEPDPRVAALAREAGHEVYAGFFNDVAETIPEADAVVFNDVLEHIADAEGALVTAKGRLRAGGRIAVTLPNARGAFYRAAEALERAGVEGPMRRLWQADYPSPHVHYFTPSSLRILAARVELREVSFESRVAVAPDSVWARVRADRSASRLWAGAVWAGVRIGMPALRRLEGDISVHVFEAV